MAEASHEIAQSVGEVQAGLRPDDSPQTFLDNLPPWFNLVLGLDDLEDAYLNMPRSPSHARANIVAVWCPTKRQWRFSEALCCLFGFSSVVRSFITDSHA